MLLDDRGVVRVAGYPKGVDNRSSNFNIPEGALRDAVNVDILSSGNIRSRVGMTQKIASSGAHSVFSTDKFMVWATANTLNVADDNFTVTTILTDNRLADPISFVEVNDEIYFSNELINGKITSLGVHEPWGITPPSIAPICVGSVVGAGVLATQYQVTCTFVTASGEESGAPLGAVVLCGDSPVIQLSSIPQSIDTRVVATRIYVTDPDGKIFMSEKDVPTGTTSTQLNGFFGAGAVLKTQFGSTPPPGQLLEYHNGCIYIAAGNVLWNTIPLRYNVCDIVSGYLPFSERVTLVKGVVDQTVSGLYVSADQTYFLPFTGTAEIKMWKKLPYRAVEGAAMHLPNTTDVVWFSERGFVAGKANGDVANITEGQLAVDKFERGAMGYTEVNGHKAIVSILQNSLAPAFVATDIAAAEILRKEEIM